MRKQVDNIIMILADAEEIIQSNVALMKEAVHDFYPRANDMTRFRLISYLKTSEVALNELHTVIEALDNMCLKME